MTITPPEPLGLILVEDHQMTRIGLRLMLEQQPGFKVLGEAEDGHEALALVKQHPTCSLVLMDIGLPEMDGIEATQRIRASFPAVKIMMLTSKDEDNNVMAALGAGANGYCLKGTSADNLANAIRTVAEGAAWLDPGIARLVLSRFQNNIAPTGGPQGTVAGKATGAVFGLPMGNPFEGTAGAANGRVQATIECPLTPREMEVLKLIVEGNSNAQIAEVLVITKATAKAHVHSILQKLCVDDRTQAAVLAMRQGLV
jgi:DNA-binding NarL/FixJ family response regulator